MDNALMVNALQRCSTVIVQDSLREGFGLTVTEGMWKGTAILASRACGIRQRIRDGIEGWLIDDPEDSDRIADQLNDFLEDIPTRNPLAINAQRRVHQESLVFTQVRRWLEVLAEQAGRCTWWRAAPRPHQSAGGWFGLRKHRLR
jgi:trehalose synthase